MTLKKEHIDLLETGNGGFNKKTLNLFGVKWPPKKGWKKLIIGREINEAKFTDLLNAKQIKESSRSK